MENNDFTSGNNAGDATVGNGTAATGMNDVNATSANAGSTAGTEQSASLKDRARGAMGTAGEKLGDVGSSVRERAAGAKDTLANALDAGAERLRARGGDGQMAGATAVGAVAVSDDRMAQVSTRVAGGMEAASEWIRDADLNDLKGSIEQQVKEHPGRTLLIAVGLGYLLGKALRR